jgi:hypothetical protein
MSNLLSQAGDWSSDRSVTDNQKLNQFLGAEAAKRNDFLNTETRVDYDDLGKKRFVHRLAMSGDFDPIKIAAVCIGVTATFTLVAAILAFTGQPGASVAVLALTLVPLLASIYLAVYEIQTRRIEAAAEIAKTEKNATINEARVAKAQFDVKAKTLLRQPFDEPPIPRALDGGEPIA